jgi:hypothetical protein
LSFWVRFLKGVEKIGQLYLPADNYDLPSLSRFLSYQCSSSMRAYIEANEGDVTELLEMAKKAKLNKKQSDLLDDLRKQRERDEKLAAIVGPEPRRLTATESLALAKARIDQRKYEERFEHWKPLGISPEAQESAKQGCMSDIAAKDLPFD